MMIVPNRHFRWAAALLAGAAILLGGCARQDTASRRQALRAKLATAANAQRRVYPYSLIPGGVVTEDEFRSRRYGDRQLANHYRGIGERLLATTLPDDRWMFASYRVENAIYWTQHKILVHAGERVLTDGANLVRGRCGNRLSDTPQSPVRRFEPPGLTTEIPPEKPLVVPETPPLTPVPGLPVKLPALTAPAIPAKVRAIPVAPPLQPPPPVWTEPVLFPPSTGAPGILFPVPREAPPEVNKPLPHVWSPPSRPVAAVPEPGTWGLLAIGLGLMSLRTMPKTVRPFLQKTIGR